MLRKISGIQAVGWGMVRATIIVLIAMIRLTDVDISCSQGGVEDPQSPRWDEETVMWLSGHQMPSTSEQREKIAELLELSSESIIQMYIRL